MTNERELPEGVQRQMMRKLLGDKKTKGKSRIAVEYYGIAIPNALNSEQWFIDVIKDGVRSVFKLLASEADCLFVVEAMRKKGIEVREFETEWMKQRRAQK